MKRTMLTALIVMYAAASAHAQSFTAGDLTPAEARAIAQEGYVFGLPLVYIAVEADVLTNVAKPEGGRAPFNQFDHHRAFPDAANNKIVGMNVDTLYSLAHLDLSAEPIVLSVPSMPDNRSWIMQIIDAWNDVPPRRVRARSGEGGHFALVGPHFRGTLPGDVQNPRRYQPLRPRRANIHRRKG